MKTAIVGCGGIARVHAETIKNSKHELVAFCDIRRFGALRRQLGEITESSLTKQLRELEADGFLIRHDYREIPPRVEYTLSDLGKSFMDVISYMKAWGERHLPAQE